MLIPVSSVVLLLLLYGILKRRDRKRHISVMLTAFAIDLGLVLYIELNRGAVEQVVEGVSGLLLFHILVSLTVLLLYVALTVFGIRLMQGKPGALWWHRRLAYVFIVGRLTNYITSFWIT